MHNSRSIEELNSLKNNDHQYVFNLSWRTCTYEPTGSCKLINATGEIKWSDIQEVLNEASIIAQPAKMTNYLFGFPSMLSLVTFPSLAALVCITVFAFLFRISARWFLICAITGAPLVLIPLIFNIVVIPCVCVMEPTINQNIRDKLQKLFDEKNHRFKNYGLKWEMYVKYFSLNNTYISIHHIKLCAEGIEK